MINLFNFLFKKEEQEEIPHNVTIKLKSTVTPEEQLTFEEWAKFHRVGIAFVKKDENSQQMMKLWDGDKLNARIKKLKLI